MRMLFRAGLTALVAATMAPVALVGVARASTTTTTFSLLGGSLNISVPTGTVNLGSISNTATSITGQLGTVTVSDNRGLLGGAWTSSVSASKFTTGGGTAAETIPQTGVTYWSGAATATSGLGSILAGQLTAVNEVVIGTVQTAFTGGALIGNNAASWNPTMTIAIPAGAIAGTYTGTVTHTVS
jgi:hypothetical protein